MCLCAGDAKYGDDHTKEGASAGCDVKSMLIQSPLCSRYCLCCSSLVVSLSLHFITSGTQGKIKTKGASKAFEGEAIPKAEAGAEA